MTIRLGANQYGKAETHVVRITKGDTHDIKDMNVTVALASSGALEGHGVRLIGAGLDAIRRAEDRRSFARAMTRSGLPLPRSGFAPQRWPSAAT